MTDQIKTNTARKIIASAFSKIPDSARLLRAKPGWVWALLSVPILLGLIILTQIIASVIAIGPALMMGEGGFETWLIPFTLFGLIGVFPVIMVWVKFVENRPLSSIGWVKTKFLKRYIRGFLFGLLSVAASVGIAYLFGGYEIESIAPAFSTKNAVLIALFFLFGFIVQGASEEIMLRGWFMSSLAARNGLIVGVLMNAIIFAAMHIPNIFMLAEPKLFYMLAIFNLILFGIFASFYALSEKSLAGVFGLHSAWNWFLGTGLGLEVSGLELPGSPWLVDLNPIGPDHITGGAFGPEGSVIETVILGSLCVLTYIIYRRTKERPNTNT